MATATASTTASTSRLPPAALAPLTRGISSTSIASSNGSERKKRSRNLLRDYYGLAATSENGEKKGDPLDIDSPASFVPATYFEKLSTESTVPELLRRENELLGEIRELDGERQSLVYNHHHELIEASDTIRKMKSRALALDASLDSLKASFQSISQLSTSLSSPSTPPPPRAFPPPSHPSSHPLHSLPESPPQTAFDPLLHLPALLSLPILLRALLASGERKKADQLWGLWEPSLRAWEEEGVSGAEEVGRECREVLRGGRRGSVGSKE